MQVVSKRLAALLLTAVMLLTVLAGCAKEPAVVGGDPTDAESPSDTATESASVPTPPGEYQYDKVYAAFAPDTPMIWVDEYVVTWEEIFYYLCANVEMVKSNVGEVADWQTPLGDDMTYASAVLSFVEEDAISGRVLEYGAKLLGAELSDEDYAELQANYDGQLEANGDEAGFINFLKENYCYSTDLYNSLIRTGAVADLCFRTLYGVDAIGLSDEDVAEYTSEDGYLMAKHILRLTQNEDDTEMTDDEKAAVLAETEEICALLEAYDGDDFDAYFDELMAQYSKDPGSAAYPEGYLFQDGDMVPEFYETTMALDIGAFSGPVQTTYGYHIIYRIPINFDSIPSAYSKQGIYYSLRYITASQIFQSVVGGWQDNVEIKYSEEYESIDIGALFG